MILLKKWRQKIFISLLLIAFTGTILSSHAQSTENYEWKNVAVGGGGFIPGIIFSKAEKDLLYTRTDVGGAYRWDAVSKKWICLTDNFTNANDWGILSLAADPVDANRVYLATGLYTASWGSNGAFFASEDKGETWTKTPLPFKLGGNDPGRSSGERLQVDPNKNNILFMGTSQDGLWKSSEYGASWTKINTFPASKVTFVAFDKNSGSSGSATPNIYVGVCDHLYTNTLAAGIYQSTDGGNSWSLLTNQPTQLEPKESGEPAVPIIANRVAMGGDYIYFSFANSISPNGDYNLSNTAATQGSSITNGAVYKYNKTNGAWTDITPSKTMQGGYGGITIHPTNPEVVVVSTLERWWPRDEIYVTQNGGTSWNTIMSEPNYPFATKSTIDNSKAPYAEHHTPHWIGEIQMDPFNPDFVMFGTGFGIYATYNFTKSLNNEALAWTFENEGLEETVPLELISPPSGAPLISAIGDFGGFKHDNLDVSPANGGHNPNNGTNPGIAFAENKPEFIVRTHQNGNTKASYSNDGGETWTHFPTQPNGTDGGGQIAVSANGDHIVWAPSNASTSYSTDNGSSWTTSSGIPNDIKPVADRVNNMLFYAYDGVKGTLYKSTDGGANFSVVTNSLPKVYTWESGNGNVRAVFGKENHIWITTGNGGLHYSTNAGSSITKVPNVDIAKKVTFGKAPEGGSYPAVFIHGSVNNQVGLYRSDDMGQSWIRINSGEDQEFARAHRTICGDRRTFGRLYIGTEGRGTVYGTPVVLTSFSNTHLENESSALCYPNPFSYSFKVKASGNFNYSVHELNGLLIEEGSANGETLIGEHLKSGVYILKINTGRNSEVIKINKRD